MNTALPLTELQVKMLLAFCDAIKSPMRPPQPSLDPSGELYIVDSGNNRVLKIVKE